MILPLKKKIWVNGTFDILHIGHIKLFEYASKLGELHVGTDTDTRVKKLKGETRPFNKMEDRVEFLQSIKYIDHVYTFDTDEDLENLIQKLKIDYIVIGSDYKGKKIIGSQYVKEVIFFERLKNYSTTKILNNEDSNNR